MRSRAVFEILHGRFGFDNAELNARNGKRELPTKCFGVIDEDGSAAGQVGCLAGG
jgi:hypothetical protein